MTRLTHEMNVAVSRKEVRGLIDQTTPYDQIKPRSKRSRSMARYIRGKRDHVEGERSQTRQVKVEVEKTISRIVAERFYNDRERGQAANTTAGQIGAHRSTHSLISSTE